MLSPSHPSVPLVAVSQGAAQSDPYPAVYPRGYVAHSALEPSAARQPA